MQALLPERVVSLADAVGFMQLNAAGQGARVAPEPVEVVGADEEQVLMLFDERFGLEAQRAAFSEGDSRKVVRKTVGPYLLRVTLDPDCALALGRSVEQARDGVEANEPSLLVQPRAGRPTPLRVALVVAGVDVYKDDAPYGAVHPTISNTSSRLPAVVLVRPDISVLGRPVDLEAGAWLECNIDFGIAVPHLHAIRSKLHAARKAMRALPELLCLAIPNSPVFLL